MSTFILAITLTVAPSGNAKPAATAKPETAPAKKKAEKARPTIDPALYRVKNRYHWAVPTAVCSTAGVLLSIGVGILFKGRSDIKDLRNDVNEHVRQFGTSIPYTYDESRRDKAVDLQVAGYALMGVAAGAAVAGAVLWFVRKKLVRYKPRITVSKKSGSLQLSF